MPVSQLDVLETYAAAGGGGLSDAALAALDEGAVGAVLHYSQRSAAIFLELLEAAGFDPAALRHIAISEDAAVPLRELDLPHMDVCGAAGRKFDARSAAGWRARV